MSGPQEHGYEEPHGRQSEDEVDYTKVIGVGVVSLIIFALSIWWASIILRHQKTQTEEKTGVATRPAEIGRDEIGIVDQPPFLTDHRLHYWKAERAALLNGYGWVDRAKGIAHVPIDKAMDAVANGALPAGAPR
jgi:hypothetical protein